MTTKLCKKCWIEKDVSDFHRYNASKDGLSWYCKSCHAVYNKNRRVRKKEQVERNCTDLQPSGKVKLCKKCWIEKDVSEFYRDVSSNSGLNSYCKACCRIYSKDWAARHKAQCKRNYANWAAINKSKVAKYQSERSAIRSITLSESYVRHTLRIPNPPQELIDLKREQLAMHRATRQLNKLIKEQENVS